MQTINICLSCDENYAKQASVVMASVLSNAESDDKLSFYILDGHISDSSKDKMLELNKIKQCEISFVEIDDKKFEIYKNIKTHSYITLQTYYRLNLSKLLPSVNKIIYLDCDTIVETSLSELFNIDLENNVIGGVLDARVLHKKKWKNQKYINAGMVLFDLQKIRKGNIENIFYEYTRAHSDEIETGDQDIINFALKDKIKILDSKWNVQVSGFASRTDFTNHPAIIHYIGSDKPWKFGSCTYFKEKYFYYLQLTSWALLKSEQNYWYNENKKETFKNFWKRRYYCILAPKYWYAFIKQYLK